MLIFALPVVAFAEGEPIDEIVQEEVVEDNSTTTEENATEGENSASEVLLSETIKEWILSHIEEIVVVIFNAALAIFYKKYYTKSNLSMGTINNNAVAIAKNSSTAIDEARISMERMAEKVLGYDTKITELLTAFSVTAEEKQKLEEELTEVKNSLKSAKLANVEFANEFAELLCLANIPNSKKEELYSRHRAAVDKIAETENTEVKEDDGAEA
jgi:hypothetical protein